MPLEEDQESLQLIHGRREQPRLPRWHRPPYTEPIRKSSTTATLTLSLFLLLLLWYAAFARLHAINAHETALAGITRGLKHVLHPDQHVSREAGFQRYSWNVTKGNLAPDGVQKDVLLINGQFPGPTIEARPGDILEIEVVNQLDRPTSFHWHGLHMRGANHMDGPIGVTQCAIPPGDRFLYRFKIGDQSGTFWYHAHAELQRADGLYGGLVIHDPVQHNTDPLYDEDLLLLIGDWYHSPAEEVLDWFMSQTSLGSEPCPDSLLINGQGKFDCSMAFPARPLNCTVVDSPRLLLDKKKSYRLRIVNTGSLTGFTINIPGSQMTVIRVDGGQPVVSEKANSVGILGPAERVDLVISWSSSATNPDAGLTISLDTDEYCMVPNFALTPNQTFKTSAPTTSDPTEKPLSNEWNATYFDLRAAKGPTLSTPLPEPSQRLMIFVNVEILNQLNMVPHGFVNRTTWTPQNRPLITMERSQWDRHQLVPWTGSEPGWVELTINNIDTVGHPFHLHGFDFFVVGVYAGNGGWDYYNPYTPEKEPRGGPFNVVDPIKKDTVFVPAYGYAVIRFFADNEGIWALHCHVLWHQASGMSMAVQVMGDEQKGLSGTEPGRRARQFCEAQESSTSG